MMTRKLAVAALVAAALVAEAAFFRAAIGAPLASALGELREPARAGTFEECITVVAAGEATPAKCS